MRLEPTERNDKILDLIVRDYIETAEPVGSRTISRRHDLGLSPASIRNVMADLEEGGLIAQPHTSAGRVPNHDATSARAACKAWFTAIAGAYVADGL